MRQKQPITQPQLFWNTPTLLTTRLDCTSANIKVGMVVKLRREKFSFKYVANERRFEHSNLFTGQDIFEIW